MNKCHYGQNHTPDYLSKDGGCCHIQYRVFTGGDTYKTIHSIWNWKTRTWEDQELGVDNCG